jgi:homoaconitate hydratase
MSQTVVEKIAQLHMAEGPKRKLRAGDFLSIRPHHVMTHDNTSAVLKKFKAIGASKVKLPRQPVFALDHDIQNTAEENLKKYRSIEPSHRLRVSTSSWPAPGLATRSWWNAATWCPVRL